jgi:hypothetical protein
VLPHHRGRCLHSTRRGVVEALQGPRRLNRYKIPLDPRLVAQFGAERVASLTVSFVSKMMCANHAKAVLMQRFMLYSVSASCR